MSVIRQSYKNIPNDNESESEDSMPLNKFLDDDEESDDDEVVIKKTIIQKSVCAIKPIIGNRPLTDYIFANTLTYNFKSWKECFPDHNISLRKLIFNPAWDEFFDMVERKPYFKNIEKILSRYLTSDKELILPHAELVFNAFNILSPRNIKVIFIGQDPYPGINKIGDKNIPQAMGVSFSVPTNYPKAKSLANIYENLLVFNHIKKIPESGCLSFWILQGCFMINANLTTLAGKTNAHKDVWNNFTSDLISYLGSKLEKLVFVAWGSHGHNICKNIDPTQHHIITTSHPSPYSYDKTFNGQIYGPVKNESNRKSVTYPSFKSTDHFGRINTYLKSVSKLPILWDLIDV